MICFRYDKTFEGLLCCLFTAYSEKCFPDKLLDFNDPLPIDKPEQPSLFSGTPADAFLPPPAPAGNTSSDTVISISSHPEQANRVWKGVQKKLSPSAVHSITIVWHSELSGSDELIFRYIRKALDYTPEATSSSPHFLELNFADPDVSDMSKIFKKVHNERLRVIQFVRFQKALDGTYFAPIEPLYNVLPLTLGHFTNRFHDQEWIVYDLRRNYGYYYKGNQESPQEITFENAPGLLSGEFTAPGEELYSQLWQTYFKAVCIKERINPRLHRQNLPVRFWKHLTEKR